MYTLPTLLQCSERKATVCSERMAETHTHKMMYTLPTLLQCSERMATVCSERMAETHTKNAVHLANPPSMFVSINVLTYIDSL